eukprot:TRINITY_DN3858_c0_g1_i5.p1 TRINITY_DN3858_c0_g1~~TRINITY_DN3858_c0_g1_i5.p1  ORF type:complete len:544 (+),score=60.24 TRINITY_DN3858_c0_g1_i5:203-1834(+)
MAIPRAHEIILPGNRIVVDYRDREELVMLAAFRTDGTEVDLHQDELAAARFRLVESFQAKDYKKLHELNQENAKGFVVCFANGDRAKVKFDWYVSRHRLVSYLTSKNVWELFRSGINVDDDKLWLDRLTPEGRAWFENRMARFQLERDAIVREAENMVGQLKATSTNKAEFARLVNDLRCDKRMKSVLFVLYQGGNPHDCVARMLRPSDTEKFEAKQRVIEPQKKEQVETSIESAPAKQQRLIVTVGVSGSGKSTFANKHVRRHVNCVRVNRDQLRRMLFGYNDDEPLGPYYQHELLKEREKLVTAAEHAMLRAAIETGFDAIADATHCEKQHLDGLLKQFTDVRVEFSRFDHVDKNEAIRRDSTRADPVGPVVIGRQHARLLHMKKTMDFAPIPPKPFKPIEMNLDLPGAFCVDLDGTLAINTTGRSPYDWDRVEEDSVCQPVLAAVGAFREKGFSILIATGRDGVCAEASRRWLQTHGVAYEGFWCRKEGDKRPDYVIKEEIWRDMAQKYHLVALLDDRDQVVKHARRLGLTVFQVADGNF